MAKKGGNVSTHLKQRVGMTFIEKVLLVVAILAVLLVVQTLPVFVNQPFGAKAYAAPDAVVYYEPGDEAGAKAVADLVQSRTGQLKAKLQWQSQQPLEIYVYRTQFS